MLFDQLKQINAIGLDVDGVMTDGTLLLTEEGNYLRTFHIRDGYALRKALEAGIKIVVISGGSSQGVEKRLSDLGVENVFMGVNNKLPVLKDWMKLHNINDHEFAYMGDDILDIECMYLAAIKACPADAVPEVKSISNFISSVKGGQGCVRELLELILKAQDKW